MREQGKRAGYFPGFDFLRFIATASIAFVFHYGILYKSTPYGDTVVMRFFYDYAWYGVELLFAVSGFLLYRSCADRIADSMLRFRSFFLGRIIRIYPVMILTVVAAAAGQWLCLYKTGAVAVLDVGDGRNTVPAFLANLLGVQSGWFANNDSFSINGPTWFVSVSMICYAFFFLIVKMCGNSKTKRVAAFFAMVLAGAVLYLVPLKLPLLFPCCGRGYVCFFAGSLLSILAGRLDTRKKQIAALIISCAALPLGFYVNGRLLRMPINPGWFSLVVALVICPSIIVIFTNSQAVRFVCGNKFVSYLGKISFSVFLWNIPIAIWVYTGIKLWDWTISPSGSFFFIHIAVSLVIAVMTYEFYERPISGILKEKLAGVKSA